MIISDLGLFRYEYHVRIGTVAAAQSYQPSAISCQLKREEENMRRRLEKINEFWVTTSGAINWKQQRTAPDVISFQ